MSLTSPSPLDQEPPNRHLSHGFGAQSPPSPFGRQSPREFDGSVIARCIAIIPVLILMMIHYPLSAASIVQDRKGNFQLYKLVVHWRSVKGLAHNDRGVDAKE